MPPGAGPSLLDEYQDRQSGGQERGLRRKPKALMWTFQDAVRCALPALCSPSLLTDGPLLILQEPLQLGDQPVALAASDELAVGSESQQVEGQLAHGGLGLRVTAVLAGGGPRTKPGSNTFVSKGLPGKPALGCSPCQYDRLERNILAVGKFLRPARSRCSQRCKL